MTLFLDACIVIYWVEAPDPFHGRLMERLRAWRKREPQAQFAVSRLSWLECMTKPLRNGDEELAGEYRAFFDAGELARVDVSAPVIERATMLRAGLGLRTPDAIQAASALQIADEVVFMTNDRKFRKVPGLAVEIPA